MLETIKDTLQNIGAVKHGQFVLKSGQTARTYVNLRIVATRPDALKALVDALCPMLDDFDFDYLCGVPYGAWPLATALSFQAARPMLLLRKETKNHGARNLIDGDFKPGAKLLLIEDVVTSGGSVVEAIKVMRAQGCEVAGVICVVDRQSGGQKAIEDLRVQYRSLLKLSDLEPMQ